MTKEQNWFDGKGSISGWTAIFRGFLAGIMLQIPILGLIPGLWLAWSTSMKRLAAFGWEGEFSNYIFPGITNAHYPAAGDATMISGTSYLIRIWIANLILLTSYYHIFFVSLNMESDAIFVLVAWIAWIIIWVDAIVKRLRSFGFYGGVGHYLFLNLADRTVPEEK